jgi:hypothetical protein
LFADTNAKWQKNIEGANALWRLNKCKTEYKKEKKEDNGIKKDELYKK